MTQDVFEAFERLQQERERKPEDLVSIKRYGKEVARLADGFSERFYGFTISVTATGRGSGCARHEPKSDDGTAGYRDPKMTMRYTHLSMDYKRQAVLKLPKFERAVLEAAEYSGAESPSKSPRRRGRKS